MLKFNANTPVIFYYKTTEYVSGQGNTTTWNKITSGDFETFYCEWKGTFGDRVFSAQSLGVNDSATLRMVYNPTIYEKLKTERVIIIKNADVTAIADNEPDKNNPNVYEIWGGVDNVKEENRYLEFKVRRYEAV